MNKITIIRRVLLWVMTVCVIVVVGGGVGSVEGRDHHQQRYINNNNNNNNNHDTPLSRVNMLVDVVDSSIWEKRQLLAGGGASNRVFDDDGDDDDDGDEDVVTIIESAGGGVGGDGGGSEDETHPEQEEDMEDYVNNAPWIRQTHNRNNNHNRYASQQYHHPNTQDNDNNNNNNNNNNKNIERAILRLVAENLQRVKVEGKCEVPQQRCEVIRSSKHTPDTFFQPRCALLHRCAEDTGCCDNDDYVCAPLHTQTVQMYFFSFPSDVRAKGEVMTFVNHTQCSCQPRNVVTNCKCPRYFSPTTSTSVDGQCLCECPIGRSKCRRYKKGRRYFSPVDITCVSSGNCGQPVCEFGPFLIRQRRCTKKRERERYTTFRK